MGGILKKIGRNLGRGCGQYLQDFYTKEYPAISSFNLSLRRFRSCNKKLSGLGRLLSSRMVLEVIRCLVFRAFKRALMLEDE
jgi:hypothetical protein